MKDWRTQEHVGLKVEVDGQTAKIEGQAKDVATREKAVLIAGNIEGIQKVDDRMTVASGGADFSAVTGGSSAVVGAGGSGEWITDALRSR